NLLDVAADIADLGEFGRLDLDEGRLCQPCKAPRYLGLAAAGRPDHQDVLRQYFFSQFGAELLTPPTVAQSYSHCTLGLVLADDEAMELRDDLARAERGHEGPGSPKLFRCAPPPSVMSRPDPGIPIT